MSGSSDDLRQAAREQAFTIRAEIARGLASEIGDQPPCLCAACYTDLLLREINGYRRDLARVADWKAMQETGDTRLIKAFASASRTEVIREAAYPPAFKGRHRAHLQHQDPQ